MMPRNDGFHWRALVGFELCWFGLVYFRQLALLPVLVYLIYGLWQLHKEARLAVVLIFLCGIATDLLLLRLNVIQFSDTALMPLWFVLIWAAFALAAVEFMAKMLTKPWLAAILGGSGGPLSYWGGAALSDGALQFPLQLYSAMVLIVVWALLAVVLGQTRRWYVKTV